MRKLFEQLQKVQKTQICLRKAHQAKVTEIQTNFLIAEIKNLVTFVIKKKSIGLNEKSVLMDYFSINQILRVVPIEITQEIFNS